MTQKRKSKRAKRREKEERRRVRREKRRWRAGVRRDASWWLWLMHAGVEEVSLQLNCSEAEARELIDRTKEIFRLSEEELAQLTPEQRDAAKAAYEYLCEKPLVALAS